MEFNITVRKKNDLNIVRANIPRENLFKLQCTPSTYAHSPLKVKSLSQNKIEIVSMFLEDVVFELYSVL